jgi:gas vesicle protein
MKSRDILTGITVLAVICAFALFMAQLDLKYRTESFKYPTHERLENVAVNLNDQIKELREGASSATHIQILQEAVGDLQQRVNELEKGKK